MDLSAPLSVVAPGARGAVLHVLLRAGEALSGREIARRAGLSQAGAARVLGELVADGLVYRTAHPPALVYELNRDHLVCEPLVALDAVVAKLFDRIRDHVEAWAVHPAAVVVFGSLARGESDAGSDVDLLVVRSPGVDATDARWEAQVSGLEAAVERWTGNPARVVEYAADQLAGGNRFLSTIKRQGITVWGQPPA